MIFLYPFPQLLITIIFVYLSFCHYRRRFACTVPAERVGKSPGIFGLWRAKAQFLQNGKNLTKQGYDRFKNSMYWIQTGDMDRLVVSNRYIDELRKLSNDYLDSKAAVVERNLGWYNGVDIILKSTAHVDVCHNQLVQNLAKVTDSQISILAAVVTHELGLCFQDEAEFQFFNTTEVFLNIVNRITAKTIVGDPLGQDATWLQTSLETTVNTGLLCRALQQYPAFLRPLVNRFLSARKKLDRSYDESYKLLLRQIKGRRCGDANDDILQWLMDSNEGPTVDTHFLTKQILFVATASVRSTAASLVNTTFDLLSYPEYQAILREEIKEAIGEWGAWTLASIEKMRKLDSFIKESQRMNHHLLLSFNRKVQQTINLADGTKLYPGTFISTSAYWAARDSAVFPEGEKFKPWRWLELRQEAEKDGRSVIPYLASSVSADNLFWGYGRNACPGRFMAAAEIKLLIAWILHHFDVVFPSGQSKRPDSLFLDERVVPDPKQQIGFRLRQESKGSQGTGSWQR